MRRENLERRIRGIPLWLLRAYLVELGGQAQEDRISGNGWEAKITQLDDFRVGSLAVGQVRLDIEGEKQAVAELIPRLDRKLLRGGG